MEEALKIILNEIENGKNSRYVVSEYQHLFDNLSYEERVVLYTLTVSLDYLYESGYRVIEE